MPTGHGTVATAPILRAANAAHAQVRGHWAIQTDHQSRPFEVVEGSPGQPGNGLAVISLPIPQGGQHYLIEIVNLASDSTNSTTAGLYVGTVFEPADRVDYAPDGALAVAYEIPQILVPSGMQFSVGWQGLSAAAICTARIQWKVMAGGSK